MRDDPSMTASRDLARARRYVLWSIVMLPVAFAGMAIAYQLAAHGPSPLGIALVGCALVTGWAAFVLSYWAVDSDRVGRRQWTVFAIGLAGAATGIVIAGLVGDLTRSTVPGMDAADATGFANGWAVLIAVLAAGFVLNMPHGRRRRAALVATGLSLPVAIPAAMLIHGSWALLSPAIPFFTFTQWSIWWTYGVGRRLDEARRATADLAVAEERLRFAAELHDIQGQHLQVIALKSELAARLADADPVTARGEMREVERLAREALTDTRAVVGGYRDVRLRTELANAVRVLTAAGIDARHAPGADEVEVSDRGAERLLGLAVREATTNMIRHAGPGRARIGAEVSAGRVRITLRNDGVGQPPGSEDGHGGSSGGSKDGSGGGLRTLRERFGDAGGELSWERAGNEFVVSAEVPA